MNYRENIATTDLPMLDEGSRKGNIFSTSKLLHLLVLNNEQLSETERNHSTQRHTKLEKRTLKKDIQKYFNSN